MLKLMGILTIPIIKKHQNTFCAKVLKLEKLCRIFSRNLEL